MVIYECSFPWCFFRSCVRDFLNWKMCRFTKLSYSRLSLESAKLRGWVDPRNFYFDPRKFYFDPRTHATHAFSKLLSFVSGNISRSGQLKVNYATKTDNVFYVRNYSFLFVLFSQHWNFIFPSNKKVSMPLEFHGTSLSN